MIITFSGVDGAGKTTQINKLLQFFHDKGYRVGSVYSTFPDIRYSSTAELKRLYLNLQGADVVHIRFRLNSDSNAAIMQRLEFADIPNVQLAQKAAWQGYIDHTELHDHVIQKLQQEGKIILFDRYYYDEVAFKQLYGCPLTILEKIYENTIEPEYAFLFEIPAQMCYERNRTRPDGKTTLYSSLELIEQLEQNFQKMALEKKMISIDGTKSREEIYNFIVKTITDNSGLSAV